METDEGEGVIPFQLEFDKPIGAKIKIAEWNPEKDLLAIVTDDSKLLLHRFNWQRLWTISLGKCITSLCWRPDGKAVAVGLHDGTISLHDVENGKLLRTLKLHSVDVMCLNWEVDERAAADDSCNIIAYEDRTSRFFPPPPRAPKMPGLVPADGGFADDGENSFQELSNSFCQHFSILCSADKDGDICFSIFGIFPIGKVNIHNPKICSQLRDGNATMQLLDASIVKVVLSKDLCQLIVLCTGKLSDKGCESAESRTCGFPSHGFYALVLDTSIFCKRKYELYQVAQQASNIEDLTEVIQESLSVMLKQWADAIHMFREKFNSLTSLISDHGLDSTPQEEFLSLLGGARTSPAIHQFLVNSLGEAGIKRVSKVVCGAGKELQLIVLDHLQPAAEMIGFRMGELRGLSRWRARFRGIGLEEKFINIASEKSGMLIVHGERFLLVLSSVLQLFTNFFNWLLKSVKILMTEPTDQLLPFSSELVIIFVKFLYDQDPISLLLEFSEANRNVEVDLETLQRIRELIHFGGFSDTEYLNRTLAEGFLQMKYCFKEAFDLPFATISQKIICQDVLPLFPIGYSNNQESYNLPVSASYYVEDSDAAMRRRMIGYISFQIPDGCFTRSTNCICIAKGFSHDFENAASSQTSLEAALLSVPDGYDCVDLSLYKEGQIVMLLNRTATDSESSGKACILLIEAGNLPFISISSPSPLSSWKLDELKESVVQLVLENEKVRAIPHSVVSPLAVSATRGLACVFAAKKRALVYILDEEDEEEEEEEEEDEGNPEME